MTITRAAAPPQRHRRLFLHELRALLRVAAPIIVSQLGNVGMSTADTIMVGPLGATPLAAVGVGSALHIFAAMVCTGTIIGMTPLVAQAYGARQFDECGRNLVQGLWLALALSIPLIAVSVWGHEIAALLGQKPDVAALAGSYLGALGWGVPPFLLFMAYRQYLEGMGITTPTAVITFIGLATNVLANRVFIYGVGDLIPAMGATGAGHATSTVRWTMLLAMLAYVLIIRPDLHRLAGASLRPRIDRIRKLLAVGLPIGLQIGLEVALFSLAAVMMGWFGPLELAAHQVTINIAATTFMVALGVSLAGSVRVGHHVGARRPRAVRRAVHATYLLALGFMAICALAFVAIPETLIGLYTTDPAIMAIGVRLLYLAAAFQIFDGAQVAGVGVLRGAADTRGPMMVAAIGYWLIGMPAAYALGFGSPLGPVGIWTGLSLSLAVVAVLLAFRVRRRLLRADAVVLAA